MVSVIFMRNAFGETTMRVAKNDVLCDYHFEIGDIIGIEGRPFQLELIQHNVYDEDFGRVNEIYFEEVGSFNEKSN